MKTKICTKCKEIKPESEFCKDNTVKNKLNIYCRKCTSIKGKQYRENNKEKEQKRIREYYRKYPIKIWCQFTISKHQRRGFKVLFTWEELYPIAKQSKYCPICNCKLTWGYGNGRQNNTPSLDRVNNENILTLDNTQIICHRCNTAKGQMNMKEFIEYCIMVSNKFN